MPRSWKCEGVRHPGAPIRQPTDAHWCPKCHGGPYCGVCLEGHLAGHRSVEADQAAKEEPHASH